MSRLQRQLARLSGFGSPATPRVAHDGAPVPARAADAVTDAARVATGEAGANAARVALLRVRLTDYRASKRFAPKPAADAEAGAYLPGVCEADPEGEVHVLHAAYLADHAHGCAPLGHSLAATGAHLAALALDETLTAVDGGGLLYLDTETTGLAGGAGTLPFLIGMGHFVAGCWHTEQMFLRRPGEEAPMLHRLARRMRAASAIVTYNGKSFDWPLLRTRFVLNRVPLPPLLPHVDLLHCARRLLPQLAGQARLCRVERLLLDFERVDDVDGALIPQLYFDYLAGGSAAPMAAVMTHNAHDLAALAAMLGVFAARLSPAPTVTISAAECLAMARLHERRADAAQALAWSERAIDAFGMAGMAPAVGVRLALGEAHMLQGRLQARAGAWVAAVAAWCRALELVDGPAPLRGEVHRALTKLYEHRLKDPVAALAHARHTGPAEGVEAMARRVARLQRKISLRGGD